MLERVLVDRGFATVQVPRAHLWTLDSVESNANVCARAELPQETNWLTRPGANTDGRGQQLKHVRAQGNVGNKCHAFARNQRDSVPPRQAAAVAASQACIQHMQTRFAGT